MRKHNNRHLAADTFSETVNLPRTSFPMRANLPQTEPAILQRWETMNLYQRVQEQQAGKPRFILHDGPPFSNGDIHLGHALNKILKDFVVKYHSMRGEDAPFVPGWDTHGLPTEIAAIHEMGIERRAVPPLKLRQRCAAIARKYVALQRMQFKRLGVRGDWEQSYLTMEPSFEAGVLEVFRRLVEAGLVYRGLKPVYWCIHCETALAEAEIDYREHEAHSVYVGFPVVSLPDGLFPEEDRERMAAVVWTTTPWTLPANVAVAVHPEYRYVLLSDSADPDGFTYLVAEALYQRLAAAMKMKKPVTRGEIAGSELAGIVLRHPFLERDVPVIMADFVNAVEGTGLVHIAPGHGEEDFIAGESYGLPIIQPVGPGGIYTAEAGPYAGKPIFEAEPEILEQMDRDGTLLAYDTILHQYPHCWRCRGPVVVRATPQWFMAVAPLQKRAEAAIRGVRWLPAWGEERMGAMLRIRPDWCLSRQRSWGTPIPAFYCLQCQEPLLTAEIVAYIRDIIAAEGSDAWYIRPTQDFLPEDTQCPHCGGTEFRKETDILDVWFDSGCSHFAVLERTAGLESPADLYLEGQDQYRGWFQVSLLTHAGLGREEAPYRGIFTHGFILDETGRKQSKSLGNIINPQEVVKKYGADILRLWVASVDVRADIAMSDDSLAQVIEAYRRVRNTLRFLLGNLYDFTPEMQMPVAELEEIDRWALGRLNALVSRVDQGFTQLEFHQAYRAINEFCTSELSAFYLDVLKDRLYIPLPDDPGRRAAQTTLYLIAETLIRLLTPIMSFTAEEAWAALPAGERADSPQLAEWPVPQPAWEDAALAAKWARIIAVRDMVNAALNEAKQKGSISQPLEAKVMLYSAGDWPALLESLEDTLSSVLLVSAAEIAPWDAIPANAYRGALPQLAVAVMPAPGAQCRRCRQWREVGRVPDYPALCDRCADVMESGQTPQARSA